jgi:hypothetical protein
MPQIWPGEHAMPQAPQLFTSFLRSAQYVAVPVDGHAVSIAGQLSAHRDDEHSIPGPHATPHAPQFTGSRCTSTHDPPQSVSPVGQLVAQWPAVHAWPGPHAVPHAPQFAGSRCTSTHDPPQSISPVGQLVAQ